MRMVYAKRMLLCRDVVAQYKIQLVFAAAFSCDRCDRVVRLAVCLCKDKGCLICIASPRLQDVVCQVHKALRILMADADHGHRPFYNACLHILIACKCDFFFDRSLCHGKFVVAALEMIVAQDRTADDRQVCV